ncbi:hypothetical protein [Mesorhizobium sp. SP-1A]|uniref:hypothetical protein n=1 Tax=Mesorhizobium sp. SP-1A TaxID=3077840 RepID=UPI0028F6E116|nr:hypothetical protein [Mesorhizobium sp. SP-1A]
MTWKILPSKGCIAAIIIASAPGVAFAGNSQQPRSSGSLPGVDGSYRIVKPLPEPDEPDAATGNRFRIGNMDVRVSGSVIVDVGAGSLGSPKR